MKATLVKCIRNGSGIEKLNRSKYAPYRLIADVNISAIRKKKMRLLLFGVKILIFFCASVDGIVKFLVCKFSS